MRNRPIPGQSLTDKPGNAPWERPPEMVDPEEALMYHIDRLTDEERMGNIRFLLEYGYDIQTLVSGILRAGVMEGKHSIDVSLIVAPVLHEYIKGNAEAMGIDYKEGFEDEGEKKKLAYRRNKLLAQKRLKELDKTGVEDFKKITLEEEEAMPEEAPEAPEEMPQ